MAGRLRLMFADVISKIGARVWLFLGLVVANSLMEGVTIALLFPLLREVGVSEAESSNFVSDALDSGFDAIGVEPTLTVVATLVISFALVQGGLFLAQSWLAAVYENRYVALWRHQLFEAVFTARWGYFVDRRGGDLVNPMVTEANRVGGAFFIVSQLVAATAVTLVYGAIALLASPRVTVILLAMGVMVFVLARRVVRRGHEVGTEITRGNDDLQALAGEFVGGAKLVKATATEDLAGRKFDAVVERLRHLYAWARFQPNLLKGLFETAGVLTVVIILGFGTQFLALESATVLVVLALFVRLYPRLSSLQQNLQLFNIYVPSLEAVQRVQAEALDAQESVSSGPLPAPVLERPLAIESRGLSVAYDDARVLSDVHLEIPAAATVGIVGPSGAGKSTLVDCLLRLVEPDSGALVVNGVPLDELPVGTWRRTVGYVGQDTVLFNATIAENVGWGLTDDDELATVIEDAARRANIHDFVMTLPDGYGTRIGDRGVRLSGGQRQRLGLARALARRPRLLILDEATSALDSEAEQAVLTAIDDLHGQMTIAMIAHRLSTVRRCDRIFLLEAGRLVEEGRWAELLDLDGRFAAMWHLQRDGSTGHDSDIERAGPL